MEYALEQVQEIKVHQVAEIKELTNSYILSGENFSYEISKYTAMPIQIMKAGVKLLVEPVVLSVWRAPIDNERRIRGK